MAKSKPESLKKLALRITARVQNAFAVDAENKNGIWDLGLVQMKLHQWLEKVSNVTADTIRAAEQSGEKIKIDDVEYLPGDLRIVKEYRNSAAAEPLVKAHDEKMTKVPFDKLFIPSLFPELDYEETRKLWLVLGDGSRVKIQVAGEKHYLLNDQVERKNWTSQVAAHDDRLRWEKSRKRLFAKHKCKTTDELQKVLGNWSGEPKPEKPEPTDE